VRASVFSSPSKPNIHLLLLFSRNWKFLTQTFIFSFFTFIFSIIASIFEPSIFFPQKRTRVLGFKGTSAKHCKIEKTWVRTKVKWDQYHPFSFFVLDLIQPSFFLSFTQHKICHIFNKNQNWNTIGICITVLKAMRHATKLRHNPLVTHSNIVLVK